MTVRLRAVALAAAALSVAFAGGEAAARLDDWMHQGVPLLASPDHAHDLTVRDEFGVHGRPGGRFKKWRLNAFGFRGAEITEEPAPGRTRLLVLGASETFGLHESEGKEYPAQLAERFAARGRPDVEVVNGAIAGVTVWSLKPYWEQWASRVRPRLVLIYPSTQLYLDDDPPGPPHGDAAPSEGPAVRSRFLQRLEDVARQSDLLRELRLQYQTRCVLRGKGDDYFFRGAPQDRLDGFAADLAALVDSIRAHGAEPILVTHALRAASPPRPEDAGDLRAMRPFFPRARPETMVAFDDAADEAIRGLGRDKGVAVIDAAPALNGRREWFADLVHFNDAGAAAFADVLVDGVEPLLPPPNGGTPAGGR